MCVELCKLRSNGAFHVINVTNSTDRNLDYVMSFGKIDGQETMPGTIEIKNVSIRKVTK